MSARVRSRAAWCLALLGGLSAGCLDEPEIEDRWTRLDLVGSNLSQAQQLPSRSTQSVTASADITYRRIITGFAVIELRASTVSAAQARIRPDAPRLPMAQDIDLILQNSVSVGRATRAVTGWDHLIQRLDVAFTATVPSTTDSSSAGLFLLCYLGSGEEVELADGRDSIVVTPFASEPYQILPVGLELGIAP